MVRYWLSDSPEGEPSAGIDPPKRIGKWLISQAIAGWVTETGTEVTVCVVTCIFPTSIPILTPDDDNGPSTLTDSSLDR